MNIDPTALARLQPLIDAAFAGSVTLQQADELESLLKNDRAACDVYCEYASIEAELHLLTRGRMASREIAGRINASSPVDGTSSVGHSAPAVPPPPAPTLLSATLHGTFGYFPEGMPLAYLIATLVTGLGLLIGSLVDVSGPEEVARQSVPLPSPLSSLPSIVGRITGMVDCQWAETKSEIGNPKSEGISKSPNLKISKSPVSLGDQFALASGLMEIAYNTGARVILQGPVTYSVEANGGYLAVGKLTGKLEKKGERRGERGEGTANHQIPNPKCQVLNSSPLSSLLSPLFVIRTPTATVTDLGTEFGVEVDSAGVTETHVFQGEVKITTSRSADGAWGGQVLVCAGQTGRCDGRGGRIVVAAASANAQHFVRQVMSSNLRRIVERFEGKGLIPEFEQMPPGRYVHVPGGVVYREPSLSEGKRTRGYIRTVAADFCDRDFVFEATVNVQLDRPDVEHYPHWIFFGIGDGVPNANYNDEPTCALVLGLVMDHGRACLRWCQPDVALASKNEYVAEVAPWWESIRPGKHRIRISKTDKWMRFAVNADYTGTFRPQFVRWVDLQREAPLLNAANSRLFVGTGYCDTMTVRFEELSLTYSKDVRKPKEAAKPKAEK